MHNATGFPQRLARLAAVSILALLAAGCAAQRIAPGKTIADLPVRGSATEPARTVFEHAAETFARALKESADDAGSSAKATHAFLAGRAMLDLQCERYLDAIGDANQSAGNERKQIGLIGGFASAIMGLTGSAAKEIAGVATGFSFASSSMDAFTTAYLFSDASRSVGKLVREGQGAWLTAVQGQLASITYADAVALLTGYEAICRPSQIRALIDDAVDRGTVVTLPTGATLAPSGALAFPAPGAAQPPGPVRLLRVPVLTVR